MLNAVINSEGWTEEIVALLTGKMANNEWKTDDSDFHRALYSVYEKRGQLFFSIHTCYSV